MTWAQVVTIVLPILVAIIIGVIYNNRRLDDLRTHVDKRIDDLKAEVKERYTQLERRVERIETLLIEILKEQRKQTKEEQKEKTSV